MAKKKTTKRIVEHMAAPVEMLHGMVIRNTGSSYEVLVPTDGDGQPEVAHPQRIIDCRIKGNFRLKGIRTTNPVAVGDHVDICVNADGSAYITAIEPRRNYIIRRASNLSKEASILAANVDQTCLVVTLAHPTTSTTFIDRYLATAEAYRVPAILVINKIDLLEGDDLEQESEADDVSQEHFEGSGRQLLDAVTYLYESIGYTVVQVSAQTGEGLNRLQSLLAGKITLISGNSGVGKSTLINRLIPGLDLRTAEISDVHDQGIHTTTFSEMFPLPQSENAAVGSSDDDKEQKPMGSNGWLIDTPGVRGFGTIEFSPYEVGHFFPEIFKISEKCRFGNCTHTHEPGCAVRQALADNHIALSRYNSYLSILSDSDPDKYRKPF